MDESRAAFAVDAASAALSVEPYMLSYAADSDLKYNGMLNLIRSDCLTLESGKPLRGELLWRSERNPFFDRWENVKALLAEDEEDWSFWVKWYQAALNGEPLNWEMLKRIALIYPEDWEQGPARGNRLIAGIEVEFELREEIAELERKLLEASSQFRGIRDNRGPSMDEAPFAKELLVIWEPVQELKHQVLRESPRGARLIEIANKVKALAAIIAKWAAGKADKAVNAFVAAAGVGAASEIYAWYIAEANYLSKALSELSSLVERLAAFLP